MQTKTRKGDSWNSSKDKSAWGGDDNQTVNEDLDTGRCPLKKRNSMPTTTEDNQNDRPEIFEVFFLGASPEVTEDQIREHFESCGEIAFVKLLMRDGEPTGRGFVKFPEEESQRKALKLNESDFHGRTLKVELPRNKAGGGGGGPRNSRPHDPGEENNSVMLRNLSYNSTEEDLTDFFKDCGDIQGCRIMKDDEGKSRGFGFIDFESVDEAKKAVAKHGQEVGGRSITVCFSRKRERREPKKEEADDDDGGAW